MLWQGTRMGSPLIPYETDSNSQKSIRHSDEKIDAKTEKPMDYGLIQYMGGHKAYPKPVWTYIDFYQDRFEIEAYHLKVPYAEIKDIGNSKESKRHPERLLLGVIALPLALSYLWKKDHTYTIIQYDDGLDTQNIVIDFGKDANYAQGLIYKKMLECRKATQSEKLERASSKSSKSSKSKSPII